MLPLAALSNTPMTAIGRLRPGAHHPDCYRYDHHLLRIGGRPWCLGCVCLWTGVTLGVPTGLAIAPWWLVGLGLAFVVPTAAQPFVQRKPYKILARTLLGVGCAWYVLGLTLAPAWDARGLVIRGAGALLFALLYRALKVLRQARLDDPCATCPHGKKPFCHHYLPRFDELGRTGADPSDRALAAAMAAHIRQQGHVEMPRSIDGGSPAT
mgnify:CR=1 FL=1